MSHGTSTSDLRTRYQRLPGAPVSRADHVHEAHVRGFAVLRRRPAVSALVAVAGLIAAGCGAAGSHPGAGAVGSGGGAGRGAPAPGPGVIRVDVSGAPINAGILAIAGEVLTDARHHDSAALDRLLDP